MAKRSISDQAIAKLAAVTLHNLGSIQVAASQEYVVALIQSLPWFYRTPIRVMAFGAELSPLPFRLQALSALDDATCQDFVQRILGKAPFFFALLRLIRTFALMDYADRLASAKLAR